MGKVEIFLGGIGSKIRAEDGSSNLTVDHLASEEVAWLEVAFLALWCSLKDTSRESDLQRNEFE